MKIIVEDSDVKEVKNLLFEYYGVILNDKQAKNLIKTDKELASELYECDSELDTYGRELLAQVLVEWAMDGMPPPKNTDTNKWTWPINADSDEYQQEFYKTFKQVAKYKKISLVDNWGNC
jgi:hypothetical protein